MKNNTITYFIIIIFLIVGISSKGTYSIETQTEDIRISIGEKI